MDILERMDLHEKNEQKRFEELCAALDRRLFVAAMEIDFRIAELEHSAGDERQYSLSLTDHTANFQLLEKRVGHLEEKLLPQAKPN